MIGLYLMQGRRTEEINTGDKRMTMRKRITNGWTIAAVAMAILAVNTNAADITYEGFQTDIETMLATEEVTPKGWRNTNPAKPLDVDGDNILGTDGYMVKDKPTVTPSYFSSWSRVSLNDNAWAKYIDDPDDPTGADTVRDPRWRKGRASDDGYYTFTITGSSLENKRLQIGLLIPGGQSTGIHTLEQTSGGTAQASQTSEVTAINDSLAAIFWVVEGAKDGDVFLISNPVEKQNCGMFVDSAPGAAPATPGTLIYGK